MVSVVPLTGNISIPVLGLGTYLVSRNKIRRSLKEALEFAYRHVDCAHVYGNENGIGEALAETFSQGKITRNEVFITSKVWNTFHSRAKVHEGCDSSLKQLNLDYLDLYLIHFPMGYQEDGTNHPGAFSDVDYLETWTGMEELQHSGKARAIGVSNFNAEQLERLLESCTIRPACNQIEVHVYLQNRKLVEFCLERNITVVAHSPLGGSEVERKSGTESPLKDATVKSIAKKHGKQPAQVLIKFLLQQGFVVIPKATSRQHMKSNLDVFDFELDDKDMEQLLLLDKRGAYRVTSMNACQNHKYYPFHSDEVGNK